jgi:hypothetical protein
LPEDPQAVCGGFYGLLAILFIFFLLVLFVGGGLNLFLSIVYSRNVTDNTSAFVPWAKYGVKISFFCIVALAILFGATDAARLRDCIVCCQLKESAEEGGTVSRMVMDWFDCDGETGMCPYVDEYHEYDVIWLLKLAYLPTEEDMAPFLDVLTKHDVQAVMLNSRSDDCAGIRGDGGPAPLSGEPFYCDRCNDSCSENEECCRTVDDCRFCIAKEYLERNNIEVINWIPVLNDECAARNNSNWVGLHNDPDCRYLSLSETEARDYAHRQILLAASVSGTGTEIALDHVRWDLPTSPEAIQQLLSDPVESLSDIYKAYSGLGYSQEVTAFVSSYCGSLISSKSNSSLILHAGTENVSVWDAAAKAGQDHRQLSEVGCIGRAFIMMYADDNGFVQTLGWSLDVEDAYKDWVEFGLQTWGPDRFVPVLDDNTLEDNPDELLAPFLKKGIDSIAFYSNNVCNFANRRQECPNDAVGIGEFEKWVSRSVTAKVMVKR